MGKNKWPGSSSYKQQDSRYWRGSYTVAQPSPKRGAAFPQYDQRRKPANPTEERRILSGTEPQAEEPSYVQLLQAGLNAARKAEQKVLHLEKSIDAKKEQWAQYLADLKAAWIAESQRHSKNLSHLQEELQKALQLQDAARAELRNVHQAVLAGQHRRRTPGEEEHSATWEAMVQAWHQEGSQSAPEAVLQRAFAVGQTMPLPTTTPGQPQRLHSDGPPPGLPAHGLNQQPPFEDLQSRMPPSAPPPPAPPDIADVNMDGYDAFLGDAFNDPYMPSPGAHVVRSKVATSPTVRVNPYSDKKQDSAQTHAAAPPGSVAATPSQGIVEALAANRAMRPFGGKAASIPHIDPSKKPFPAIIQDDEDDTADAKGPDVPGEPS